MGDDAAAGEERDFVLDEDVSRIERCDREGLGIEAERNDPVAFRELLRDELGHRGRDAGEIGRRRGFRLSLAAEGVEQELIAEEAQLEQARPESPSEEPLGFQHPLESIGGEQSLGDEHVAEPAAGRGHLVPPVRRRFRPSRVVFTSAV
jgi:hypothetical protein